MIAEIPYLIKAMLVTLVGLAMIRCALVDFKSLGGRLFGVGGAIVAAIILASYIDWRS